MEAIRSVPPSVAASIIGKSTQFVRIGLQRERLPIGTAVKTGNRNYNYHISPVLLCAYAGCTMDDIREAMK